MIDTPLVLGEPTMHTVSVLVQNQTGTINRLVSMFRRRGFSLASFNAGDCEEPGYSRITFVVKADQNELQQVLRQVEKTIDVVAVEDLKPDGHVGREVALVRLRPSDEGRKAVYDAVMRAGAKTPEATDQEMVVEYCGEPTKIEELIERLRPHGIVEIVRSGLVAIKVEG